uniref:TRASH domain-containing protein n=1 Tax=Strigamia maritima TaxID=126957 RepID=T1J404_STRMM
MSDLPNELGKSIGKNEANKKVTPFRFDSAPTRVRFDSAPTRFRLDDKQPSKSTSKKPVNMPNEENPNAAKVKSIDLKAESEKKIPKPDASDIKDNDTKSELKNEVKVQRESDNKYKSVNKKKLESTKSVAKTRDKQSNEKKFELLKTVAKTGDKPTNENKSKPPKTTAKIGDKPSNENKSESRKTMAKTGDKPINEKKSVSPRSFAKMVDKPSNEKKSVLPRSAAKTVDCLSIEKNTELETKLKPEEKMKVMDEFETEGMPSSGKIEAKGQQKSKDKIVPEGKPKAVDNKELETFDSKEGRKDKSNESDSEKKDESELDKPEKIKPDNIIESENEEESKRQEERDTSSQSDETFVANFQSQNSCSSTENLKDDGQDSNDSAKKESCLLDTIKRLEDRIKRSTSLDSDEEHESEVDEIDEGSEDKMMDKLDGSATDPKSSSTQSVDSQDDLEGDIGSEKSCDKSSDRDAEAKLMEVDEEGEREKDVEMEINMDMDIDIKKGKASANDERDNLIEMDRDDSNLPFEICDVRTVQDMDESSSDKNTEEMETFDEIKTTLCRVLDEIESKEKKEDENEVVILSELNLKPVVKREKDDGVIVEESLKKPKPSVKSRMPERLCIECDRVKCCKYQVHMSDTTRYLCDDNCFKSYRNRTKAHMAPAPENRPITRSLTQPKDYCSICRKEIKNGVGFLSGGGENKPLCSEDCMRKYYMINAPKRGCAQCGNAIQGRNKCLTWETMEFCNEECLGKYQSFLGSHCAKCCSAVQRTSLGKYCVRFGSDIKQFCCNNCLEEFKKTLRVCTFCQKDISTSREGLLARIGEKGVCKDFCSKACVEKFESMNKKKSQPNVQMCSVCSKVVPIKVQVNFEGRTHCLCSDPCIAAFRYANKISTSICDSCHKFFHVDASQPYTIQFEGLSKRFCAKSCMNVFVLSHRKIVPCTWCKVKKYNFDMIERVDSNNHVQLFCSLNCLSLFRVSLNATSAKSIRCDHCNNSQPAQYHLTMSDASIRNFCSYQCVMTFQRPFTNIAPVTSKIVATSISTTPTVTTTVSQTVNSSPGGTPIISSVRSLAPVQSQPLIVVPNRQTGTSIIATSLTTTNTVTKPATVASTSVSTATQSTTQVLIKPPAPKQMKNKSLMCRPFMQTKGVSCKPHPCHKNIQTEPEEEKVVTKPLIIPVPVPIYVPVPMHMYVRPVPVPIPFPIPIPVPIFIPTSKNTVEEISKQIKEIQDKIPNNPFEAELLMMAEMVANNNKIGTNKSDSNTSTSTPTPAGTSNGEQGQVSSDAEQSEQFGMENQISDGMHATNAFSDDMLQMALRMATEMDEPAMDVESALGPGGHQSTHDTAFNSIEENNSDVLSPRELRARNRGQKRSSGSHRGRGRKKPRTDENSLQMTPGGMVTPADSNSILKYTYGVNAWKHWVLEKNTQLEKASQNNRKLKLFKTDLLQLTADELNYSLCLFVKEVRKPNREEYASDSIFYLCLGIQQYLLENGRIDNIFTDAYYEKFTECLNEVLQKGETIGSLDGVIASRIEEEMLWEAKQLGAHSPHVLLNTLMYFNAKFFLLRTVEDHMRLSFSHILKQWKKSGSLSPARAANQSTPGRNVLLRYCPPSHNKGEVGRKRKDDQSNFEQVENLDNPLRCPVKLYEFYLSKCPESIRNRSDVFYLNPERSCVPDSPVWYSTMPLGKEAIAKMLQRIKNVREVCEVF